MKTNYNLKQPIVSTTTTSFTATAQDDRSNGSAASPLFKGNDLSVGDIVPYDGGGGSN